MRFQFYGPRLVGLLVLMTAAWLSLVGASGQSTSDGTVPDQNQIEAARSRMFHGWTIETIPQILSTTTGLLNVTGYDTPGLGAGVPNEAPYPPPVVVHLVCTADVGIVGTIGSGVSHMTSDQKFLYTDWSVTVDQVIDNLVGAPVSEGQTVTVARSGGSLEIDGRTVVATNRNFTDFVTGERYALFLEFVPQADSYKANEGADAEGLDAFLVDAKAAAVTRFCNARQK
jgi:hypothetical protein